LQVFRWKHREEQLRATKAQINARISHNPDCRVQFEPTYFKPHMKQILVEQGLKDTGNRELLNQRLVEEADATHQGETVELVGMFSKMRILHVF
jgi:hypothetical protein